MTDNKKMTKRELFTGTIALFDSLKSSDTATNALIEKLQAGMVKELEMTIKKSQSAKTSVTPAQKKNATLRQTILDTMGTRTVRAGELAKELDLSTQKVTALFGQLVKAGSITKATDGKVTTYTAN